MVSQGRLDEAVARWRTRFKTSGFITTQRLATLLTREDRVDTALDILRGSAWMGRWGAADRLAKTLVTYGRTDELPSQANNVDRDAILRDVDVLIRRGLLDEAIVVLRKRTGTGGLSAAQRIADLMIEQGRPQEAIAFIRVRADAGEWGAPIKLAELL